MRQLSAEIMTNTEPMPGYRLICVEAPDIAADARAGQFVTVKCGDNLVLRRPLSIHRIENSGRIYFLFAVIKELASALPRPGRPSETATAKGEGTEWLSQRNKGEKLDLLGPLGNGFFIEPDVKNLLLVAGGIGIAPLAFLAQQALAQRKSVTLLLGARTEKGLYPANYLPEQLETITTTEDGSCGNKGKVSDIMIDYVNWADQIYACGPKAMYQTIKEHKQRWSVKKPVQISLEVRMGCGLGACYGCSVPTKDGMKRVCLDGPVFNLDDVELDNVLI